MVSFKEYVDAVIDNDDNNLISSCSIGVPEENESIDIDNNQLASLVFDDQLGHFGEIVIYKRKLFDERETIFIIKCKDRKAVIAVNDIGYGGIHFNEFAIDKRSHEKKLSLGFLNEKYYIYRLSIGKKDEYLNAEDWSVDRILDEILKVIKSIWKEDSEVIFNVLKPALELAILDEKEKWMEYLNHWKENYDSLIKNDIGDDKTKEKFETIRNLYEDTVNTLQSKDQKSNGKCRK